MRLKAYVKDHPQYKKLILYQTGNSVYLFLLFDTADGSEGYDDWYQTVEEAKYQTLTDYQVEKKTGFKSLIPFPVHCILGKCQR